jgi:integrase
MPISSVAFPIAEALPWLPEPKAVEPIDGQLQGSDCLERLTIRAVLDLCLHGVLLSRRVLKMQTNLQLVKPVPDNELCRVKPPGRKRDAEYGRGENKHLRPDQVRELIRAEKEGNAGLRDSLMISLCWHHALRASELDDVQWSDIDFVSNRQPLQGEDLRALRRLHRQRKSDVYVFTGERGHVTRSGFAKILQAREARGHGACKPGHALAIAGRQAYDIQQALGHKSLANSGKYINGISGRLRGLWDGI